MRAFNHWLADRKFKALYAESKRRGAAVGKGLLDDDFDAWAEAVVRPVVYLEFGAPKVAPEALLAQRTRLETMLAALHVPAAAPSRVKLSFSLTALVLLTGAIAGLLLDLSGSRLESKHWITLGVSSFWLVALLHVIPVGLHLGLHSLERASVRMRRWRIGRKIAGLAIAEERERELVEIRDRAIRERLEILVEAFRFYRAAGQATLPAPLRAAA